MLPPLKRIITKYILLKNIKNVYNKDRGLQIKISISTSLFIMTINKQNRSPADQDKVLAQLGLFTVLTYSSNNYIWIITSTTSLQFDIRSKIQDGANPKAIARDVVADIARTADIEHINRITRIRGKCPLTSTRFI